MKSAHDTENTLPDAEAPATAEGKKGRPTPSRKEQQAAKAQHLIVADRKEAKRRSQAKMAEQRELARVGMAAGDPRYLPARDQGPQRKWVRDFVDGRVSVGEFLMPAMLFVLAVAMIPSREFQQYTMFIIWGFVACSIFDALIVGARLGKKLAAEFGAENVQPGYRWYAAMRMMQMRVLRLPKPQKRIRRK